MPTYEYHCDSCGETYDLHQGFSAETHHTCEECGKGIAKRVLHAPRVVFKGSGWYVTDSRNSSVASTDSAPRASEASEPAAASEATSSDSAGSDKASEAKPASKSETATSSSGDSKVESSAAG